MALVGRGLPGGESSQNRQVGRRRRFDDAGSACSTCRGAERRGIGTLTSVGRATARDQGPRRSGRQHHPREGGQEQGEGVGHEVMEGREAAGEEEGQMRYGGLYKAQSGGKKPEYVGTDFEGHRQTREEVDKLMALQRQQWANESSTNPTFTDTIPTNYAPDTINPYNPIVLEDVNVQSNIKQHKIPTVGDV